nr:hypothetical protein [uncultured Arsenicibacter sp.]
MTTYITSTAPFQQNDTGYANALRFMRAEGIPFPANESPDVLIDLANGHAKACNLLIIDYDRMQSIVFDLRKTPAIIWEQDVTIPHTGQVIRFQRSIDDTWRPVTPVLYLPDGT